MDFTGIKNCIMESNPDCIGFSELSDYIYKYGTLFIALVGLVLSLRQTYLRHKENKRKLTFGVIDIFVQVNCVCVKYWVYSGSSKPINITRIQAIYNSEQFDAVYIPTIVQTDPNIEEIIYPEKSDKMPLYLAPYGSHSGFIAFPRQENNTDTQQITLKITTGEGKPITVLLKKNSTVYIERKIKKTNHYDL